MTNGRRWLLAVLPLAVQFNVLTYQYGEARLGANVRETVLTPAAVSTRRFGKLGSFPVDGQIYGQPLYLGHVRTMARGVRNVVFVATEHDSVYAFDADAAQTPERAPLWRAVFLDPGRHVTSVPATDFRCTAIVPEIGITSTPVIDAASGTIYIVAMTKEVARGVPVYVQRLHALDVATGVERPGSPVQIAASVRGTGDGATTVTFSAANQKQRAGLLLLNGVVYTAWSSHCDRPRPFHGWIIGYDARTLHRVRVYNATPNGSDGAFWSAGAAPAADARGDIYEVTGNGTFDESPPVSDYGSSYLRLSTSRAPAVTDFFTPFNSRRLNRHDLDLASGGVVLLPDEAGSRAHRHLLVGAGKEGRIYLLDRDRLGRMQRGSDSAAVQSLPDALPGYFFGNPAYFMRKLYFCSSDDRLRMFSIENARIAAQPVAQSTRKIAYPGCVPSISANGATSGIVWALAAPGTLFAFDASNVGRELFSSDRLGRRDALGPYVKFSVPTIADGKVYAGTARALVVYGLRR